jgi:MFS family permease
VGLSTGDAIARFGLGLTLAVTLVSLGVAAGLVGLAPGPSAAVAASAVLFGAGTMFMSALLSVWSSTVFRERPSTGFSAALLPFGLGSILGPATAGAMADEYGMARIFLFIAALAISTALIRPEPNKRV